MLSESLMSALTAAVSSSMSVSRSLSRETFLSIKVSASGRVSSRWKPKPTAMKILEMSGLRGKLRC